MQRLTSILLGLAMLAGSALAATDVQGPQGLLKGQVPDNVAALKRVAIATFFVQYVTDFGIETKRKKGGVFFSKWAGPSPEVLQGASDALYDQLVADLKAAGVEVVASDQLDAQVAMADLRKVARPNLAAVDDSTIKKGSVLVSARNLPLVLATLPDVKLSSYATQPLEGTDGPGNLIGWDKQSSQWLLGSNMELMSLGSIHIGQAKIAESLNATVLNVRLTIPLVDLGVTTCGNVHGWVAGSQACRGYGDVTGLIKPNPRFVEAGTVFSFAQGGQQSVLGLQKPVSITGLKVTPDPGMKSLDQGFMGLGFGAVRSARGGGGIGALLRGAGVDKSEADFWVNVDAAEFQPALVGAGSTIFKELAQIMAGAK